MKKQLCFIFSIYIVCPFTSPALAVNEESEDYSAGYEDGWIEGYSEAEREYEDDYSDGRYDGYDEGYSDAVGDYNQKIEDGELIEKEEIERKQNNYLIYIFLFVILFLVTSIAYILYTKKKAAKDTVLGILIIGLFLICLFAASDVFYETVPSNISKFIICGVAAVSFYFAYTYHWKYKKLLNKIPQDFVDYE